MNIRRLRKLAKFVRTNPSRYDQNQWCGTKACLAGHAAILAGIKDAEIFNGARSEGRRLSSGTLIDTKAAIWLGINDAEADRLFDTVSSVPMSRDAWPQRFCERYRRARTAKTRAKVAADRIEHFINTGGCE